MKNWCFTLFQPLSWLFWKSCSSVFLVVLKVIRLSLFFDLWLSSNLHHFHYYFISYSGWFQDEKVFCSRDVKMFMFSVISETSKMGRSSYVLPQIRSYTFDCFFRILGINMKLDQKLVRLIRNNSIFLLALLPFLPFYDFEKIAICSLFNFSRMMFAIFISYKVHFQKRLVNFKGREFWKSWSKSCKYFPKYYSWLYLRQNIQEWTK